MIVVEHFGEDDRIEFLKLYFSRYWECQNEHR
jgi:hypothetical protein